MTESELQKSTLDLAKRLGWRIARFPAANWTRTRDGREFVRPLAHDTKGFPDTLLVRDTLLAVEFKGAKGKLSPAQEGWRLWLLAAGVPVFVWRPADWESGAVEAELR